MNENISIDTKHKGNSKDNKKIGHVYSYIFLFFYILLLFLSRSWCLSSPRIREDRNRADRMLGLERDEAADRPASPHKTNGESYRPLDILHHLGSSRCNFPPGVLQVGSLGFGNRPEDV